MNLRLRNERLWIWPALLIAATQVHRVQCEDDWFKTYFDSKKAGFLTTDKKTYHVEYEIDLDDAVEQSERFIKRFGDPLLTVGPEPSEEDEQEDSKENPKGGTEEPGGRLKQKFLAAGKLKRKPKNEECVCTEDGPSAELEDKPVSNEEIVGKPNSIFEFSKEKIESEENCSATETVHDSPVEDDKALLKDDSIVEHKPPVRKHKKKSKKPFIVTFLKNFKLRFNLPLKLNKFPLKHSSGKEVKDEDDYYDGLVT